MGFPSPDSLKTWTFYQTCSTRVESGLGLESGLESIFAGLGLRLGLGSSNSLGLLGHTFTPLLIRAD